MLALGSTQEVIERQMAEGKVKFDLGMFLQNVVLSNIANPGLCGRCASQSSSECILFLLFFSLAVPVRAMPLDREQISLAASGCGTAPVPGSHRARTAAR